MESRCSICKRNIDLASEVAVVFECYVYCEKCMTEMEKRQPIHALLIEEESIRSKSHIFSLGRNQTNEGAMKQEKDDVLTTKEACRYLRISRSTFVKLVNTRQMRARKVGKGWKVLRSQLRGLFAMENGKTSTSLRKS
jgi:excisionase family DNA binding protein